MAANPVLLFGFAGSYEWIVIALIALLLFGNKLPKVARNLGRSMIEFKKGVKGTEDDLDDDDEDERRIARKSAKAEAHEG